MAPSPAADVRELRVVRGDNGAFLNLSFSVEAGTATGLLCPSGSGKTTLIRSIVGEQIAGGSVRVLGEEAGLPSPRSRVGYGRRLRGDGGASGGDRVRPPAHLRLRRASARVSSSAPLGGRLARDVAIMLGATVLALLLGALKLRRRTA
jgi:ABC-type iron transport system FetAB ATPase subunit